MASYDIRPTIDLPAGRGVLAHDLPRVLANRDKTLDELGWRQLSDRVLIIPMTGELDGKTERYVLRLDFLTGRDWPPSARFVNPETLDFVLYADQHHLPRIDSPEVQMHADYQRKDLQKQQLICCSATYEYYDVEHGGDKAFLWRSTDTFLLTLDAIERAIRSPHYKGRFAPHAG